MRFILEPSAPASSFSIDHNVCSLDIDKRITSSRCTPFSNYPLQPSGRHIFQSLFTFLGSSKTAFHIPSTDATNLERPFIPLMAHYMHITGSRPFRTFHKLYGRPLDHKCHSTAIQCEEHRLVTICRTFMPPYAENGGKRCTNGICA